MVKAPTRLKAQTLASNAQRKEVTSCFLIVLIQVSWLYWFTWSSPVAGTLKIPVNSKS